MGTVPGALIPPPVDQMLEQPSLQSTETHLKHRLTDGRSHPAHRVAVATVEKHINELEKKRTE